MVSTGAVRREGKEGDAEPCKARGTKVANGRCMGSCRRRSPCFGRSAYSPCLHLFAPFACGLPLVSDNDNNSNQECPCLQDCFFLTALLWLWSCLLSHTPISPTRPGSKVSCATGCFMALKRTSAGSRVRIHHLLRADAHPPSVPGSKYSLRALRGICFSSVPIARI